jgi:hypothetical protein
LIGVKFAWAYRPPGAAFAYFLRQSLGRICFSDFRYCGKRLGVFLAPLVVEFFQKVGKKNYTYCALGRSTFSMP